MAKAKMTISYEKWRGLSPRDKEMAKLLGIAYRPRVMPRKNPPKPVQEYNLHREFTCLTCGKVSDCYFQMRKNGSGTTGRKILERPNKIDKFEKESTVTCPKCLGWLIETKGKVDLARMVLSLSKEVFSKSHY